MKFVAELAMLVTLLCWQTARAQTVNARLSLDSNNPVQTQDMTSSTIYYMGKTLALGSLADGVYDVYEGGSGNLVIGPAWVSNAPVIGDIQPAMTNAEAFTTSETCAVNACTLLGSIHVVSGEVTCDVNSYGTAQQCGLWNYWNRQPYEMKVGPPDPGAPSNPYWQPIYQPSYAPLFGAQGTVLIGRPELVSAHFFLTNWMQITTGSAQEFFGIGWDSTIAQSGFQGTADIEQTATNIDLGIGGFAKQAKYVLVTAGLHTVYPLFKTQSVPQNCVPNQSSSCIYMGKGEDNVLMTAEYDY